MVNLREALKYEMLGGINIGVPVRESISDTITVEAMQSFIHKYLTEENGIGSNTNMGYSVKHFNNYTIAFVIEWTRYSGIDTDKIAIYDDSTHKAIAVSLYNSDQDNLKDIICGPFILTTSDIDNDFLEVSKEIMSEISDRGFDIEDLESWAYNFNNESRGGVQIISEGLNLKDNYIEAQFIEPIPSDMDEIFLTNLFKKTVPPRIIRHYCNKLSKSPISIKGHIGSTPRVFILRFF